MNPQSTILSRTLFFICCPILLACGGGGGGSTSTQGDASLSLDPKIHFGGAACESGVSLGELSAQGYDYLYNFETQANPPARIVLDTAASAEECQQALSTVEVFPWIRIDQQSILPEKEVLTFQLVEPGGRNAPIVKVYEISEPSAQSISGEFSYSLDFRTFDSQANVKSEITCEIQYTGSYCPMRNPAPLSSDLFYSTQLRFTAEGQLRCQVNYSNGRPPGRCQGTLSSADARLDPGYYGE